MATIKELLLPQAAYNLTGSALLTLANNASWQMSAQDNSTALWLDALVQLKVTIATVTGTPLVWIYAYGSADGTTYPDGVTGTDGAYTLLSPTNLRPIGSINTPTASGTYTSEPIGVAAAFGGTLPTKWGIIVQNLSGGTWAGTTANFSLVVCGVQTQVV
jgi:hypothetical protein